MPWITLTTEHVIDELSAKEVSVVDSVKGREALAGIVERVVSRVRGAVFAGGTVLGEDGTIPDSLVLDAVAIARWRFLIGTPRNEAMQTEDRRNAAEQAEKRLAQVEAGELKVEPGAGGSETGSGVAKPVFGTKHLHFTKRDQDGI